MATAIVLGRESIHRFQSTPVRTSQFREAAKLANSLAQLVETSWARMPSDSKDQLKSLIYTLIDGPLGFHGFVARLKGRVALARIVLWGQTEALYEYLHGINRLQRAVLGAIEREQLAYQEMLQGAIEQVRDARPVPEDIGGWLSSISDQARREI